MAGTRPNLGQNGKRQALTCRQRPIGYVCFRHRPVGKPSASVCMSACRFSVTFVRVLHDFGHGAWAEAAVCAAVARGGGPRVVRQCRPVSSAAAALSRQRDMPMAGESDRGWVCTWVLLRTFGIAWQTDRAFASASQQFRSCVAYAYVEWLRLLTARAVLCVVLNSDVCLESCRRTEFCRRISLRGCEARRIA